MGTMIHASEKKKKKKNTCHLTHRPCRLDWGEIRLKCVRVSVNVNWYDEYYLTTTLRGYCLSKLHGFVILMSVFLRPYFWNQNSCSMLYDRKVCLQLQQIKFWYELHMVLSCCKGIFGKDYSYHFLYYSVKAKSLALGLECISMVFIIFAMYYSIRCFESFLFVCFCCFCFVLFLFFFYYYYYYFFLIYFL